MPGSDSTLSPLDCRWPHKLRTVLKVIALPFHVKGVRGNSNTTSPAHTLSQSRKVYCDKISLLKRKNDKLASPTFTFDFEVVSSETVGLKVERQRCVGLV